MKKLLLFLFLPLLSFGQDYYISHSYIDAIPENGFAVGDTITVKFEGVLPTEGTATPDYAMFDYEFNNKLLEFISAEFNPENSTSWDSGTQTNRYSWTGYSFNENENISTSDLDGQYDWFSGGASTAGENSYPTSADWTVNRIILQNSTELVESTPWLYVKFKIKDRQGTNYTNYNNVTNLSWAVVKDIGDNSGNYDVDAGTEKISLSSITGVGAGTITLKLNTPAKADYATDFGFSLFSTSQLDTNGYPAQNEMPLISGNFDANGEYELTDLELDETYWIHTHVVSTQTTLADGTVVNGPSWLDDVLTVTDVYLIFQEAIGAGTTPSGTGTAFTYQIQYEIGEITNSGNVDFEDSYEGLAFLAGTSTGQWYTSTTNGALNLSGDTAQFGVSTDEYYFGLKHTFTVDSNTTEFNVAHAFKGDPDFSHSYTPTANGATINGAQTTARSNNRISLTANAQKTPTVANLDILSQLVDGKVEVSINITEEGIVGSQFDITYDNTVLSLDNVIFDTGNQMTNFTKHHDELSKVFIGSLDQKGEQTIKTGTPYKLVFTPKQAIQNTAGLVTFKYTEGVKSNGTKVKFNIQ